MSAISATPAATRLTLANVWVAVAAFALGSMMAVMQALARAGFELPFGTARLYYVSVTSHGVLLALVFTTFFIMALGYLVADTTLGRVAGLRWAWAGFWIALVGTVMTTLAILSGTSTVLYTFYPPLRAHPAFYLGATLLVIGSWVWCGVIIGSYRVWRAAHHTEPYHWRHTACWPPSSSGSSQRLAWRSRWWSSFCPGRSASSIASTRLWPGPTSGGLDTRSRTSGWSPPTSSGTP